MKSTGKKILGGLFLLISSHTLVLAQKYTPEVEARIKKVEANLSTWIKIEGQPNWSLKQRMAFYHTKAVSVAVIKDYKIEWAKAYGWADTAEKRKATPGTLFQAASNSISLNAMGVVKLAQEGKLNLDSNINNYLQSWKFPYDSVAKGKKITTAQLLSHSGGVSTPSFAGYLYTDTLPTLVQILNGKKPANSLPVRSITEPGVRFEYSGGSSVITQLMIQDLSGMPYDQYMKKNVLDPLGMTNSFYTQPPPASMKKQMATGYYDNGQEVRFKHKIYPEMAAAGLWSTPTDLAKYVIETQLALQGKSSKVLSKEFTQLRLTPQVDSAPAMGMFISNRSGVKYFSHGGGNEGFVCQFSGSLEGGNGVVVMINNNNSGLLDEIVNSVASVYKWPEFYKPEVVKEIVLPKDTMDKFAGMYKIKKNTFEILKKDGALFMSLGNLLCKMHFTDYNDFFIFESYNIHFKFAYTKDRRVGGFTINGKDMVHRLQLKQ